MAGEETAQKSKFDLVEKIRHENEILRIDLTNEARASKSSIQGGSKDVQRLQEQGKIYVRKIETERRKIEEINKDIIKYQELILEQKKRFGGVSAATTNNQMIQKQIRVLENRLDKSLLKFNDTLAMNKVLRQRIDEYRRERVIFDNIYKKLERELHDKKKEMSVILEDSKNAYLARDRAAAEMASLQQRVDKEKADFEAEFKELGELIRDQQAMLDQLRLRQFERADEAASTATTILALDNGGGPTGSWSAIKDPAAPLSQEKIQLYEAELEALRAATGLSDVDAIVTRFLEAEEQNFSLFNYVNSINSEVERLEHSISDIKIQIEKYRGQGMSSDTQRKKALKDLDQKIERTQIKIDNYEGRAFKSRKQIGQFRNGIHSIFARIGAASVHDEEVLGNLTESNMLQYLGIIEQKTTEVLQAYAATQLSIAPISEQGAKELRLTVVQQKGPVFEDIAREVEEATKDGGGVALDSAFILGDRGDDDENSEDERPLTRHELDKKTLREFSRKK